MPLRQFFQTLLSGPPRATEPCRCLFLLEAALSGDEGAVLDERNPDWIGHGEVTLAGHQMRYCPKCGGRVGRHRPELIASMRTFIASRPRYGASSADSFEAFEELCDGWGLIVDGSGYQREATDRQRCITLTAAWDPDHERVYITSRFAAPSDLLAAPYRECIDPQRPWA